MKAESFWYRLKRFLFKGAKKKDEKIIVGELDELSILSENVVEIAEKKCEKDIRELTQKVLKREIDFQNLSNEEIEMVSNNIRNEIQKIDKEIKKTKKIFLICEEVFNSSIDWLSRELEKR